MTNIALDANSVIKASFASLQEVEYSKLFEIAKHVKENGEISQFEANPVAYASSLNGFTPPPGFHMHIVDSNNNYHPAEDDAISQLNSTQGEHWTRIEVRAGYSDIACIICLWCKGRSM